MQKEEVYRLLELTENDLYLELGRISETATETQGWRSPTDWQFWEWGKQWFNENNNKIHESVCTNSRIQVIIDKGERIDDIHLCFLIIDSIAEVFKPVHIPLISVLIVKKGLVLYCGSKTR